MIYLLDANTLIDAYRDYYSFDMVPEFWEWLVFCGEHDSVKIPIEIFEELKAGDDKLAEWAKDSSIQDALLFNEDVNPVSLRKVVDNGYANDLTDIELDKLGRDPFLIAYALVNRPDHCIVTTERSKPRRTRANRNIPDVCNSLDVKNIHTFKFIRELGFKTNWK